VANNFVTNSQQKTVSQLFPNGCTLPRARGSYRAVGRQILPTVLGSGSFSLSL